jgi:NAD(P)-dependent dehydrogenase (short-subunit alcohol dehydrogenase family)
VNRPAAYDFSGRTAIVTGGAGGFGRAIAARLHQSGAAVALWDADREGAQRMGPAIGAERVFAQQVDITDEAAVAAAARVVLERFGSVDMLINNAGILGPVATTWEHTTEAFRRVLDVNLTGAFICSRVIVPIMLASSPSANRGRIVFVSSIQAKEGMPRAAAYAASKAGLIALTKTLGKELAESGILVNAITPAIAETAMAKEITPERRQDILARIPMRRLVRVDEIAAQVAWLCSDDCSFATGAVFDLSGGRATY